jgi:hypothetical protein
LAETVQGEAVTTADAGFLENVLQMNLDGSGPDTEFLRDFPILEALFDEFHDLVFARR